MPWFIMDSYRRLNMRTLEEIKEMNVDKTFIEHMVNAMVMSAFKYGDVKPVCGKVAIEKMNKEIEMFMEDGNTEHMVNIANYAMLRYMFPSEGEAYKGTDSDKSVVRTKPMPIFEHLRRYIMENN
jgi:hypothetical protein